MSSLLYFVEVRSRRDGSRYFLELDRDSNSAGAVRCLIRHDDSVIKVLEVCEDEGTCRDVTDDIRAEALAHIIRDRDPVDHQAARWDHDRDQRKHEVPA